MRDISKNIRWARTKQNMTQEDLAQALFVTRQTVSNYETGKSRPDVDTLLQLAQVLETDVNTLIYGPPVPENRRQAVKWLILSGVLLALLAVGYMALFLLYKKYEMRLYFVPLHLGNFAIRPLFLFVFGWMLLHTTGMLCKWKLLKGKVVKILRIVFLVFLAVVVVAVTPFVIWLAACLYQSITRSSVNMTYPAIPVYYQFLQICVHVLMKYPFVCTLLGGLCWVLGIPNHQKASADH